MIVNRPAYSAGTSKACREGEMEKHCPWCWRFRLKFRGYSNSVRFRCAGECGYMVSMSRGELSPVEEKEIYG